MGFPAAPLWGGYYSLHAVKGDWVADGRRHPLWRAQRALKGMGLIGKKERSFYPRTARE